MNSVVVVGGRAADPERALPVLAADAETGLDHLGKHQDAFGLAGQIPGLRHLGVELLQSRIDLGVDIGGRRGRGRSQRRQGQEEEKEQQQRDNFN
jgi:hypothetical protein